jgi:murein DD-endopeptidase MepM/ murein hydrolase activator NlpD
MPRPPGGPARARAHAGRVVRHLAPLLTALALIAAAAAQERVHVVRPGDTLYDLAREYDTTVDELRDRNDLRGDLLRVGSELRLPGPPGWREVRVPDGLTWTELATREGVPEARLRAANPGLARPGGATVRVPPAEGALVAPREDEDLLAFAARLGVSPGALAQRNGLAPPYPLDPARPLLVPEGAAPPVAAAEAGGAAEAPGSEGAAGAAAPVGGAAGPSPPPHAELRRAALAQLPELLARAEIRPPDDDFAWPLDGPPRITSTFGWRSISVGGNRYHQGLDLGAPTGTTVRATRDGTVVRSGWIGAYGYAVYVRHEGGFETRYAHLSQRLVAVGEVVRRGEAVGRVGSTGASTGPHLHFEVRRDGRALDPLAVLPPAGARSSTTR